ATIPKEEMLDVVTSIGIIQQDMMDPLTLRGSHVANIRVTLTAQSARDRSAEEIIEFLRPQIDKPENVKKISYELVQQGPPQGRPISINIKGEDFVVLQEMANEFKQELKKIEAVKDIRDSYQMGKTEWQVLPKNNEASYGLTFLNIAETVRAAFDGIVASSVRALDEEIDIRVKLKKQEGAIEEQLQAIKVGNNQGNLVNLPAVAKFVPKKSLNSISHSNFKRMINVSAGLDTEKASALAINESIKPILKRITERVPGYNFASSGEDKDTQESMKSLLVAFIFAACIIFSLLIMTFRSLLQPILILSSIPLGFIGVIWAMFIHGRPFSFMAMLGVIALAGVIVNNAIVFTDFVNRQRLMGRNLDDSIVDSATTRLRPILLTTVTTICGLLPTAYGDKLRLIFGFGGGDPFVIPIALALGWGLAFGSTMTGLFFPAFIRILDDVQLSLRKLFS
ncbi:MAG: efflux RND transporter permease subunit, partial [Bdellovibrionales bacterium]|nr:efflux RND transporter permease subunit [Bdellovibrionales bacterium]